jgi:putative salt-induced outer membrane protein
MFAAAASAAPIPGPVAAMIDAAAATGDAAALKAVADAAKATNPASTAEIDAHIAALQTKAEAARVEKLAHQGTFEGIHGSGEAGLNSTTGNTRSTGIVLGATLSKETLHWKHKVTGSVDYQRDNGLTSKDRYFAGYEGNYKFNARLYALGILSWEKDRFAGFSSRFTESLGLGYKVIDSPKLSLAVEGGPALRQTDYIALPHNSSAAARVAGNLAWTLAPATILTEDASAYIESRDTTLTSTTAITTKLVGALSARASFRVQNESSPPFGLKQTDTTSRFTLVYGF